MSNRIYYNILIYYNYSKVEITPLAEYFITQTSTCSE